MNDIQLAEQTFTLTRIVNETAIREHALRCSAKLRAGRFERVGQDFVDEVRADVEAILHNLNGKWQPPIHAVVDREEGAFVTGALMDRLQGMLNDAIGRRIQERVQRHPSVGKTLKT